MNILAIILKHPGSTSQDLLGATRDAAPECLLAGRRARVVVLVERGLGGLEPVQLLDLEDALVPDGREFPVSGVGGVGAVGGDVVEGDEAGGEVCEDDVLAFGAHGFDEVAILSVYDIYYSISRPSCTKL